MNTFDEYQQETAKTAIYPNLSRNITYVALGLGGESGEVLEKIKKVLRDKGGVPTQEDKDAIVKEMGDVMWYLSQMATELGVKLSDVATKNIEKLRARKDKGTLQGNGDNR